MSEEQRQASRSGRPEEVRGLTGWNLCCVHKLESWLKRQRGECSDVAGSEEGEGEGRELHKVTTGIR